MKLGAEKWVDFRESSNVIEDVKRATDGSGPKAAIMTASDVRLLPSGIILAHVFMGGQPLRSSRSIKLLCTWALLGHWFV